MNDFLNKPLDAYAEGDVQSMSSSEPLHLLELSGGMASTMSAGFRKKVPNTGRNATTEQLLTLSDGGTVRLTWLEARVARDSDVRGGLIVFPGLNNSSHWGFVQHTMR